VRALLAVTDRSVIKAAGGARIDARPRRCADRRRAAEPDRAHRVHPGGGPCAPSAADRSGRGPVSGLRCYSHANHSRLMQGGDPLAGGVQHGGHLGPARRGGLLGVGQGGRQVHPEPVPAPLRRLAHLGQGAQVERSSVRPRPGRRARRRTAPPHRPGCAGGRTIWVSCRRRTAVCSSGSSSAITVTEPPPGLGISTRCSIRWANAGQSNPEGRSPAVLASGRRVPCDIVLSPPVAGSCGPVGSSSRHTERVRILVIHLDE